MAFADPTKPNLPDFILFCRNQGVTTAALPDDSPYFLWSLNWSEEVALYVPQIANIIYVLAVYNLGMHRLVKTAQDTPPSTFFKDLREKFHMFAFVAGPVASSADQGTSESLVVPDFMKGLTFSALDLMKTPWGLDYLDYAQQWGPNVLGVS